MEALVCRSGSSLLTSLASKQPPSKTSRSQSALLRGPHSPHLFMSPQRIHSKQNERRSQLVVFAKAEEISSPQPETFQAASRPTWIGVGLATALVVSAAFLPSVTLGPLEFLRKALYRVGPPQMWQSFLKGGVVMQSVMAAVAFILARSVEPRHAALWFLQTFFLGPPSFIPLLQKSIQKSKQKNVEQNL